MNHESSQIKKGFLIKWIITTSVAWPVGIIGAIIFSELIVSIFYHKTTNLVVGLCVGAVIGYSQWLVLKKNFSVSSFWGLACAIGVGVPFIAGTILDEIGIKSLPDSETLSAFIAGIIGGLLSGLLQMRLLKPYSLKSSWWLVISTMGWGLCFLSMRTPKSFLAGGIILGAITGVGLLLIIRLPIQSESDALYIEETGKAGKSD
jgi:hypothetical protein